MRKMQMTLVFNPAYDGGTYVPEQEKGQAQFFRKHVGCKGLLDELELRLGLKAKEPKSRELLTTYLKALQNAEKRVKLFCSESLNLAPLETAKELLAWRDELVLAGWTSASPVPGNLTTGAKNILNGLAAVEKELPASFQTESDRWQGLMNELEKDRIPEGLSILIAAPETHFHPLLKTLFDKLRQAGVKVDPDIADHDPDTTIKHFRDSVDACLWAAACETKSLLVCSDSQTLGSAMAALGKARVNTVSTETPKPVEHLFVSAMMLVKDGGDLQAMRDYLSSPSHPLNKLKPTEEKGTSLREALLRHIINKGGFGENKDHKSFLDIVEEYAGGNRATMEQYLSFLPGPGEKLTFKRVKQMCDNLAEWANGALRAAEKAYATKKEQNESPYADQWKILADYCRDMELQCRELDFDKKPVIEDNAFIQAIRSVYTPGKETIVRAEVESTPVVPGIKNIAGATEDVIWIDGAYSDTHLPLSFLCKKDIAVLSEVIPGVWKPGDALALEDDLFKEGLSRIGGNLTILFCDKQRGEKKEKHPFIVQKAGGIKSLEDIEYEKIPEERKEVFLRQTISEESFPAHIDIEGMKLPDHESPSSLEIMLDQPFDWFADKVLELHEEGDTNMSQVKGNVAHDVIHKLYDEASKDNKEVSADSFVRTFLDKFDAIFDQAVLDTGAELTYAENAVERTHFKNILKSESIPELINIVRFSGLTIVGSEVECKGVDLSDPDPDLEPLLVDATIDLLLKNRAGNYVILDFKWTGTSKGKKTRENQIKKGEDFQLALYRDIAQRGTQDIPKGHVDAQGFYMLRTAELLTAAESSFRDRKGPIECIPVKGMTSDKTMTHIRERYTAVIRALREGNVPADYKVPEYLKYKVLKGKIN